jgi:penicillin-binding protein-related factor A (putative recombinase)
MKRGESWERQLEVQHHRYRSDRRALILRAPSDRRKPSPPDYFGVVGGRFVCFEAKDSKRPRFAFDLLIRHQAIDLEATNEHGGCAFVLARLAGDAYLIPWRDVSDDYFGGKIASVAPLPQWACDGADWLPTFRRLWKL